jgi:hypothetical protein
MNIMNIINIMNISLIEKLSKEEIKNDFLSKNRVTFNHYLNEYVDRY